jgi:hypothetical protein
MSSTPVEATVPLAAVMNEGQVKAVEQEEEPAEDEPDSGLTEAELQTMLQFLTSGASLGRARLMALYPLTIEGGRRLLAEVEQTGSAGILGKLLETSAQGVRVRAAAILKATGGKPVELRVIVDQPQ